MLIASIISAVLWFVARRVYDHTPRANRWWIALIPAGIATLVQFIIIAVAMTALTGLLATIAAVIVGVYLREILNGLGRIAGQPKLLFRAVGFLIATYIALLIVVDRNFRASVFSLAFIVFALGLMLKGFKPIKAKK